MFLTMSTADMHNNGANQVRRNIQKILNAVVFARKLVYSKKQFLKLIIDLTWNLKIALLQEVFPYMYVALKIHFLSGSENS